MATSSSDLKSSNKGQSKKSKKSKYPKDSVVTRLKQAAERAVAKEKENPPAYSVAPNNEATTTLTQLMANIDEQLLSQQQTIMGLNRPSYPARDSMTAIMMHNDRTVDDRRMTKKTNEFHLQQKKPMCQLSRNIAMVMCKPLMDGRISLEQDARIRRLVHSIQEEEFQPYSVAFVGSDSSQLSMEYFQSILQQLNIQSVKCIAETTSIPEGGLNIVCDYFHRDLERLADKLKTRSRRVTFHIQFALISSDYHLCVLNDIHVRSPSQSFLEPLEHWELDHAGPAFAPPNLVIKTSWIYLYASTVDLRHNEDENLSFLSACYRRGQQLIPVLMNLRAVCANREFFQRDNYRVLVQVRRSFITDIERLYRDKITFARIRKHLTHDGKPLDIVLEEALLSLGRCSDLVRPAGMLTGSVPAHDFRLSVTVLEHAITQISLACDPDRPLPTNGEESCKK